jgi:hypothetical protein
MGLIGSTSSVAKYATVSFWVSRTPRSKDFDGRRGRPVDLIWEITPGCRLVEEGGLMFVPPPTSCCFCFPRTLNEETATTKHFFYFFPPVRTYPRRTIYTTQGLRFRLWRPLERIKTSGLCDLTPLTSPTGCSFPPEVDSPLRSRNACPK